MVVYSLMQQQIFNKISPLKFLFIETNCLISQICNKKLGQIFSIHNFLKIEIISKELFTELFWNAPSFIGVSLIYSRLRNLWLTIIQVVMALGILMSPSAWCQISIKVELDYSISIRVLHSLVFLPQNKATLYSYLVRHFSWV